MVKSDKAEILVRDLIDQCPAVSQYNDRIMRNATHLNFDNAIEGQCIKLYKEY